VFQNTKGIVTKVPLLSLQTIEVLMTHLKPVRFFLNSSKWIVILYWEIGFELRLHQKKIEKKGVPMQKIPNTLRSASMPEFRNKIFQSMYWIN